MPIICPNNFESLNPLRLTVGKSGGNVTVFASNTGRNIIFIKRMLLRMEQGGSTTTLYIREGGFFDFTIGGERLEQGSGQLKFSINYAALRAEASAEYIETTGRSRSALVQF